MPSRAEPIRHERPARPGTSATARSEGLTLLADLERTLGALEADLERARERAWIETFIFRADTLGQRFAKQLVRARARGVDVRVLYDSLGSRTTPDRFFAELREQGVEARPYRDWPVVLRALRAWPRDHARLLCFDDSAYTGGLGFGDEWLPVSQGGKGWHDVCVRVTGAAASLFCERFQRHWQSYDDGKDAATAECDAGGLSLVTDSPLDEAGVYARYREAIQRAERRVWIENAYFLPPRRLLQDLYDARARGVEVHVVLPGDSDLPSMERAARAEYATWIEHGLEIFEYPGVTHAKVAVVDDDWCTVGSFNLNPTSLVCSRESNVFVRDRGFVAQLAAQLERDRAASRRVLREDAARQPLRDRLLDRTVCAGLRSFEQLSRLAGYPWT